LAVAGISEAREAILSVATFNATLFLATVGFFWAGVFVLRSVGRPASYSLSALGFRRPRMGVFGGFGLGFLVGLGSLVLSMALNPATALVLESLGYSTESTVQQPFMQNLEEWVAGSPVVATVAILGVVVIFGSAVEELVFRGAIFNGLHAIGKAFSSRLGISGPPLKTVRRMWFILATLLSSVFFALLHFEPVILPALVVLAVALCWLFEKTGSLIPPIVAHATFNSFAAIVIILSGLGIFEI
jgi:membrane protease YdiL (CAAX protease family)